MCVLYVSFGLRCDQEPLGALPWVVLFIFRSRLLVYSTGSGVNRVQVVLSRFSAQLLCLSMQKLYVGMVVCLSLLYACLCVYM